MFAPVLATLGQTGAEHCAGGDVITRSLDRFASWFTKIDETDFVVTMQA